MNRTLLAVLCFAGGGLAVGLTNASMAQDRQDPARDRGAQERPQTPEELARAEAVAAAEEAKAKAQEAEAKAQAEKDRARTARALELVGRVVDEAPSSDGLKVMEVVTADQIRAMIKEKETVLAGSPSDADTLHLKKLLEEYRAMLVRAERGEKVWHLREPFGPGSSGGDSTAKDPELEHMIRKLEQPNRGPHHVPVYLPSMPDAFKVIEAGRMGATLLLDTRTGMTWWLDKSSRGVGFEWRAIERELPLHDPSHYEGEHPPSGR